MLIGHLPAGYLLSRSIASRLKDPAQAARVMACGLAGSVLPDIDMLWFYLVDAGQVHHHRYPTHWPSFWLVSAVAVLLVLAMFRRRHALPALALFLNALAHLGLDTIVGDIWWFAPLVDQRYSLFTVPAVYKPWALNFVLHWSFALELALIGAAGWQIYQRRKNVVCP